MNSYINFTVANAVVILLAGDLLVWNTGSIIVAVVLSASINRCTFEAITSVSSLALADVVVDGSDEGGVASGMVVATSSVDGAGVDLDAFALENEFTCGSRIEIMSLTPLLTYPSMQLHSYPGLRLVQVE